MKALIMSLVVLFTMNVQAMDFELDRMSDAQKTQLLSVLNTMEPEALEALLSEEAYDWYIQQFQRETEEATDLTAAVHGRIEFESNPYEDPKAPTFD